MILPTEEGFGCERLVRGGGRRPAGGDWSGGIDNGVADLVPEEKGGGNQVGLPRYEVGEAGREPGEEERRMRSV
jgi:hypothetical protein